MSLEDISSNTWREVQLEGVAVDQREQFDDDADRTGSRNAVSSGANPEGSINEVSSRVRNDDIQNADEGGNDTGKKWADMVRF